MASSSESDLLISSEDLTDDVHEVVHPDGKGKEKMFEPSESNTPLEAYESSPIFEVESSKGDIHVEWEIDTNTIKIPEVGQVFVSEEEAHEFYNAYARKEGFSIRKDQLRRWKNGKVCARHFTCSRSGHRKKDHRRVNVKKRRAETRTGCMACFAIKRNDDDTWVVKEFVSSHNHPKVTPSKTHLLRSQRRVQPSHVARIIDFEDVGVPPADGIELMAKEVGGKENLGITILDYRNYKRAMKTVKKNQVVMGEAQKVMDYFKRMQLENPSFFYAVQVNSLDQITNFFWADARSIMDYGYFGDVVCFDTTYRTNKHYRPFAPFVGVNHHMQTILFGAALLLEETTDSFIWLFETFLQAMSGRKPKTILTDQCAAMMKAINTVMPETHHRLCLWHIFQNAAKHLSHVYKNVGFSKDFKKCIYTHETEEGFFSDWNQMLRKYGLEGDTWLEGLFEFRKYWAMVYGRNTFCANMTTTQRSESINSLVKRFFKRKHSLPEILQRYEKILNRRREKELEADFVSSQTSPVLYINAPMLKQVVKEYTTEVFEKFQKEFQKFVLYDVESCSVDGSIQKYKVTSTEGGEDRLVTFDASQNEVLCSCKKFEFAGFQCRHVIKVLNYKNLHSLPSQYILKRWTKDAKVGDVKNNDGNSIQAKPSTSMGLRYGNICRMAVDLATKGAVSEEAHLLAISSLKKALKDMEAFLKKEQVIASHKSIHEMNDGGSSMNITLTLAQGHEKGRPTNARMKSCLERGRGRKRSKNNLHGDSGTNTDLPRQKRRKGKCLSVERRNNDPIVNLSCLEKVPTQFSQITTQDSESTHAFQEPYQASVLQQHPFLPYLGVLSNSSVIPMSDMSIPFPSIFPLGGTSTAHVEPILPGNMGGHLRPPSIG